MNETHQGNNNKNNFRQKWVLQLITALALVYLLTIPIGLRKDKFEPTDVVIFITILLFNSGLVERLTKVEYKDGSLSIEIDELKKEQETQKERLEANTEVLQRLASLEQAINNNNQENQLVYRSLINEYELKHLQRLASEQTKIEYEKRETFKQELRRLRTLGFIETIPGKHIGLMKDKGNLRDYVRITDRGKEYLNLVEQTNPDLSQNQEIVANN